MRDATRYYALFLSTLVRKIFSISYDYSFNTAVNELLSSRSTKYEYEYPAAAALLAAPASCAFVSSRDFSRRPRIFGHGAACVLLPGCCCSAAAGSSSMGLDAASSSIKQQQQSIEAAAASKQQCSNSRGERPLVASVSDYIESARERARETSRERETTVGRSPGHCSVANK